VHEQIQGKLPYAFADWGAQTVKNIFHPVHVHALGAAAIAALADIPAATQSNIPRPGGSRRRWWLAALGGTTVTALAIVAWLALVPNKAPPAAPVGGRFSIIVMPFSVLSAEPGQDYLADILNEQVTTSLARLLPGRVIARSTAYTYRGKSVDVKQVGKELGVRYVLEGSEQHDAKRVRLDAQLINAVSGTQLWADQFDAERADLLQMQDELVTRLSRALQLQFMDVEAARVAETPPANLDADDLAMRCVAGYVDSPPGSQASGAALQLCNRALQIDPRNVRALILLAQQAINRVSDFQSDAREADIRHADELISRALAIDPNSYGAHGAKSGVLIVEQRFDEAIFEAKRALDLNPAFISAYISLCSANNFLGRPEKAIEYADRAMRISPRDPQLPLFYLQKGLALLLLNQNGQALDWLRRTTLTAPEWPIPHAVLAATLAQQGDEAEAHAELERYLAFRTTKAKTIAQWRAQLPSSKPEFLAEINGIIEGLRKAGMPEQ
jgi:TolB-like protein/Flp pilus assembly protein TadD